MSGGYEWKIGEFKGVVRRKVHLSFAFSFYGLALLWSDHCIQDVLGLSVWDWHDCILSRCTFLHVLGWRYNTKGAAMGSVQSVVAIVHGTYCRFSSRDLLLLFFPGASVLV